MIHADQLTRTYQIGTQRIDALARMTLTIHDGERTAIIGRSGSGKSTLLNLLAGLDRPSSGTLCVNEQRLDQISRNEMAEYRLRTIGVIFQSFQLVPQRTALQNVELPLILSGVANYGRKKIATEWLTRVGLYDRRDHLPSQLSGGEQQRVAIARALVNRPKVILADEPTGNLDTQTASEIMSLLMSLCQQLGTTSVIVTHDGHVAKTCSQRQFRMTNGALAEVTADEVL
ncbi:MAG: ABC transporter ATP-binding protein [Planctomycetaceae bacterium]|nr:ABC transporter ATP-binding protein [Planctomycetaceae bacterium]